MVLTLVTFAALTATPEFSFGFTNENGTQLLALPPVSAKARLTRAVCDGRLLEVKYLREQPKGAKDTGRQTARNFSQSKGALFKLTQGTMPADALCLIGTSAAFSKRKLLSVSAASGDCDEKTTALAAELGKRKVTTCVSTATLAGGRLSFASYVVEGTTALAAIVLTRDDAGPAIRKFPANWEKGSPSCWRVDDGCQFDPASYRIAFAMSSPAGLELYALWGGAEGENGEVLRIAQTELKVIASANRYWSPE